MPAGVSCARFLRALAAVALTLPPTFIHSEVRSGGRLRADFINHVMAPSLGSML